jgi:hypothetical protein
MYAVQAMIESAVASARFSGPALGRALVPRLRTEPRLGEQLDAIWGSLDASTAHAVAMGLVRAAFLIELVNDTVTSTKFELRWTPRLANDPRGCSFDECCAIFKRLSAELSERVSDPAVGRTLTRFHLFNVLPYEMPIDYIARLTSSPIHRDGNLAWIWADTEIARTLLLREGVRDAASVHELTAVFARATKKIQVKTYLTDRALTGVAKTNREKRWEAHPASVQFASRRDCLKIEHKLLSQVCHFEGFPNDVRALLRSSSAILDMELPARCPITRDQLDFTAFRDALNDPDWGRSQFQVGHLNPLKGPGAGAEFGHTPANIAWISADGNRVQGSLSYAETMTLLARVRANFELHPPLE